MGNQTNEDQKIISVPADLGKFLTNAFSKQAEMLDSHLSKMEQKFTAIEARLEKLEKPPQDLSRKEQEIRKRKELEDLKKLRELEEQKKLEIEKQ